MNVLLELIGAKKTAVLAGFDPAFEYLGYGLDVVGAFVGKDDKLWAEVEKNWQREIKECSQQSHPDDILNATLASWSEIEKGGLRRRTLTRMDRWDLA